MSLRSKIALALFAAVSLFATADQVLNRWFFGDGHRGLDEELARQRIGHAVKAFEHQLVELDRICGDLAARIEASEELSAVPGAELILSYDAEGWVHEQRLRDPHSGEPIQLRELPNERLSPQHPLVHGWVEGESPRGLLVTERGGLLVSVRQFHGEEDTRCLAAGRFLSEEMLEELRLACGAELEVTLVQEHRLSQREEQAVAEVEAAGDSITEVVDGTTLQTWTMLPDLRGNPALLLRLETSREVYGLWTRVLRSTLTSMLALVVLFPFSLLLILQRIVTGPLDRLSSHAVEIGRSSDTAQRLNMNRDDEIGRLADEFDGMLEKLARSRKEVVRNAHLAGMSEVSANILHNTRNALNSVRVSVEMVQRQLVELSSDDLRVALLELEKHSEDLSTYLTSDERGQHLLPFFTAVVDERESRTSQAISELGALSKGVEHISSLVCSMDSCEAQLGLVEELDLGDQLSAALELCLASFDRKSQVEVRREYDSLPPLLIERHKLMQIFVNLLLNALQAIEDADSSEKLLVMRLVREGDESVRIEIEDSGVGIMQEDVAHVFASGFSTRSDSPGLGLHLAATTATELGASIEVRSEGVGRGATFALRLPMTIAGSEPPLGIGSAGASARVA